MAPFVPASLKSDCVGRPHDPRQEKSTSLRDVMEEPARLPSWFYGIAIPPLQAIREKETIKGVSKIKFSFLEKEISIRKFGSIEEISKFCRMSRLFKITHNKTYENFLKGGITIYRFPQEWHYSQVSSK